MEWEYGMTDTIEINVKARNFIDWSPISESGNVTIKKILKHEPGNWQPEEVSISNFIMEQNLFTVVDGETLIEVVPNSSALVLDKAYEFEFVLEMNLSGSGTSEGWAWFKLSNSTKPSAVIVDSTGSEVENFFGDMNYTLQVSNVQGATLRNMWGPGGNNFNTELMYNNDTSAYETAFITPPFPGWYTLEIEVQREGYNEFIYVDFDIGGGTEMHGWSEGNVIPGVNFSVIVELFGQGSEDPWCIYNPIAHHCGQENQHEWFGPLTDKKIILKGIKDLDSFTFIDMTAYNITQNTLGWEEEFGVVGENGSICNTYNMTTCQDNSEEGQCRWEDHDGGKCFYEFGHKGGPEDEEGIQYFPGMAVFNLNPEDLNLTKGKKYDLVFSYNDSGEELTFRSFAQVESYHVAISKNEDNLAPKKEQSVWLKTTDLYGIALPNCNITFTSIYDERDFKLVKSININNQTDANGTLVFTYETPSIPGYYLVEGESVCNVTGVMTNQEISYFIEVGSKQMDVDMKTKFGEGENIKISISTKDRLGNPKEQRVEVMLFHDREDFSQTEYSLGGADCTILDAGQEGMHGDMMSMTNRMEVMTDSEGNLELELCPLPNGNYMMNIFPMMDFMEMDMDKMDKGNEFGFFNDFVVSSADITVTTSQLAYMVGDNVTMNISVMDENGDSINGQIVAMDSIIESLGHGSEIIVYDLDGTKNLTNGTAQITYTVPANGTDEESGNATPVTSGPVDLFMLIVDEDNKKHIYENALYTLVANDKSSVTADASVRTNSLIDVHVETDNTTRTKVQAGVFFLKDNTAKEKDWFIEGGVFLEDQGDGTAGADFQILSPNEPGNYLLAMPIFPVSKSIMSGISGAVDMLITEIEVTLDLINVTGTVKEINGSAIEGALVQIGKKETFTDASGDFVMQVPKGKVSVYVENKVSSELRQFMKTDEVSFDTNKEINVTFYRTEIIGDLSKTLYNITSLTNLETETKLTMTLNVTNLGDKNFTDALVYGVASSGKMMVTKNITAGNAVLVTSNKLYAGFEDSKNELIIKLKADPENWDSTNYIFVSGVSVNSTVGSKLVKKYEVVTYAKPGDGIDNDNDGSTDEEKDDNIDNDGDGRIDEDLESPEFIEGGYCGDNICKVEEEGSCHEDCGMATSICGDNNCTGDENYTCVEDCGGSQETCDPWTCQDDGYGDGQWCNQFGVLTDYQFCDYCSGANPEYCGMECNEYNCWACDINGGAESQCEDKGCKIGTDDKGDFCYYEAQCGPYNCYACDNSTECSGTGFCEWDSNDDGQCKMPWDCSLNCDACGDESSCKGSNAFMIEGDENVSCIWKSKDSDTWCQFNFTHGGWENREVKNFWIALDNTTIMDNATADFEGFSGNWGNDIDEGCYYIHVKLGDPDVNISINGSFKQQFAGSMTEEAIHVVTDICYLFTNGTWTIETEDLLGPDDFFWEIGINVNTTGGGGSPPPSAEVYILSPNNGDEINSPNVTVVYNITGDPSEYNFTSITIENDTFMMQENRTDVFPGVYNYTFTNISEGPFQIFVDLFRHDQGYLADDSINISVNFGGMPMGGIEGYVVGSPPYGNVTVEIKNSTQGVVSQIKTNNDGLFHFDLDPANYTLGVMIEDGCIYNYSGPCPEQGISIFVEDINVDGMKYINVSIPHVSVNPLLDYSPMSQGVIPNITQNSSHNFSLFFDNKGGYAVNGINMEFNASDPNHWGNQTIFNQFIPMLNVSQNATITIPFMADSATLIVRSAMMAVDFNISINDVISGDVTGSEFFEVIFDMQMAFNITGGI